MTVPSLTVPLLRPRRRRRRRRRARRRGRRLTGPELLADRRLRVGRAAARTHRRAPARPTNSPGCPAPGGGPQVVAVIGLGERADRRGPPRSPPASAAGSSPASRPSRSPCPPTTRRPLPRCSRVPRSAPTPTPSTAPDDQKPPVTRDHRAHRGHGRRRRRSIGRARVGRRGDPHGTDLVNTPPADLYPESFADIAVEAGCRRARRRRRGLGRGRARGRRIRRHPRRRQRLEPRSAARAPSSTLRAGAIRAPRARRQGHHLRLRRALAEADGLDGRHEVPTWPARPRCSRSIARGCAELGLPVRITGWLCLAENMPSGTATRPNDVLRIRGGKTVEVLNTDAEGRLVLADGLVAASEEQPDAIVDVATLTGAAGRRARRPHRGASWATTSWSRRVVDAGRRASASRSGRCRCPPSCGRCSKSDVADIANAKLGRPAGGMLLAGVLPASSSSARAARARTRRRSRGRTSTSPARRTTPARGWGFTGKGATGVAVRTLARGWREQLFRRVVRSYAARNRLPLRPAASTTPRQSRVADQVQQGSCGCPSRTLTLSSWVAEAVATPRRCAPVNWA